MDAADSAAGWHGEIRHARAGDIDGVAALAAELALSFEFSPEQFRLGYPAVLAPTARACCWRWTGASAPATCWGSVT